MSFARNLFRDLVEKRLWPVALLLVVAIAAIPVLLGGGGDNVGSELDATLPVAPASEAGAPVKPVDVALVGPPAVRDRSGKTRDPFRRPPEPKVKAPESVQAQGQVQTPAPGGGGATAKPGPTGNPGPIDQIRPRPVDPSPERSVYKVLLSWGNGADDKKRPVRRLTPLGDPTAPAAIYLGVLGGKYAMFLLGPQSTSEGEAECADGTDCRVLKLKTGQTQIIEVARAGAEPLQYQLDVASVDRDVLDSRVAARRRHDRVHPDGRETLLGLIKDRRTAHAIVKFAYDRDRGLVRRAVSTP